MSQKNPFYRWQTFRYVVCESLGILSENILSLLGKVDKKVGQAKKFLSTENLEFTGDTDGLFRRTVVQNK